MKHVLAIIIVLLSGCQSVSPNAELRASLEGTTDVDVVLKKLLPPTVEPDVLLADASKIKPITAFVVAQDWCPSPSATVASMPTAEGYQFWLIFHRGDGAHEVIGVKEGELVREGYRSRISKRELRKLATLCELAVMEPFTVD